MIIFFTSVSTDYFDPVSHLDEDAEERIDQRGPEERNHQPARDRGGDARGRAFGKRASGKGDYCKAASYEYPFS
jgi:hypothetical protein